MEPVRMDHRRRVTRMLIRRAFTQLLQQKPIQGISVKELCAFAGINRGTFYAHYTDLYALFCELEEELLADFERALAPLLAQGKEEVSPLEIAKSIFQCLQENGDICAVILGPYGDKAFVAKVIGIGEERYLEVYSAAFPQASRRQLSLFYTFASAGCIGILEKWFKGGMAEDAEELARACESIMMRGADFLR